VVKSEVWPIGSESFEVKKVVLKLVDKPSKDSVSLSARWRNAGAPLDAATEDLMVDVGWLRFVVPAGAAKIKRNGKISYKAELSDGSVVKVAYLPKNGALKLKAKRMNLPEMEEGDADVTAMCGARGATRTVRLVRKGKKKMVVARD
jgi:hypothetical protein